MSEPTSIPARSEVPQEQTWNLESIYPDTAAWDAACQELQALIPSLSAYQGRLAEGPQVLLEFLRLTDQAGTLAGKINTYASNALNVNTLDQAAVGRAGQARGLMARLGAAAAFYEPELVAIGFVSLRRWLDETPELRYLEQALSELERNQQHVRSSEVEEVLAMAGDAFGGAFNTYSALTGADMSFEPAVAADGTKLEIGQSSIGALISHPDREVRRTAWENYSDGYLKLKNTHANTFLTSVKQDVFRARVRGYESALNASLEPNFIPVEVFHNLINVFQRHLPTWHRYWALRKRVLGYDQFHVYDIKAPLTQDKPQVSFRQAVDWIVEGMAPLGQEYTDILRRGCLEERWVDWACNKGKRDGAYSSGSYGTNPFILMSFNNDVFSLSTLAHELGHSMHSYYSRKHQPFVYSWYGLFIAEVASNFNQATVRDHLFRTQTDKAFQIALIEEAMSNYHRYFFIMPTLARFELEVHQRVEKGAPLSGGALVNLMADLFKEGYGDGVVFDQERIGITWAQFLHMYLNFYVYQYTTGIAGAHALSAAVTAGQPGAAERYLGLLKAGGSAYPLDALKAAGVDLASPEPVEAAFNYLDDLVNKLDSLL